MQISDEVRSQLAAAQGEALRVGDSPLRADRLAERLPDLVRLVEKADAPDELKSRLFSALENAERALRRDDDGREAARHLQAAVRLAEDRPRTPSPFLDD
jgi:hypothetical protein